LPYNVLGEKEGKKEWEEKKKGERAKILARHLSATPVTPAKGNLWGRGGKRSRNMGFSNAFLLTSLPSFREEEHLRRKGEERGREKQQLFTYNFPAYSHSPSTT